MMGIQVRMYWKGLKNYERRNVSINRHVVCSIVFRNVRSSFIVTCYLVRESWNMKNSNKLKNQLIIIKKYARSARDENAELYLGNMGLLYMQVAIEGIIKYLEMSEEI